MSKILRVDPRRIRVEELHEWVLQDPLSTGEEHAISFYENEGPYGGPGPVRIIPGVVPKSLLVFREALQIAKAVPGRRIGLAIALESGPERPVSLADDPGAIEAALSLSPPSLILSDEADPFREDSPALVLCRAIDLARAFGRHARDVDGCGCVTILYADGVSWQEGDLWRREFEYRPYILVAQRGYLPDDFVGKGFEGLG